MLACVDDSASRVACIKPTYDVVWNQRQRRNVAGGLLSFWIIDEVEEKRMLYDIWS
jgi:hypothetical protein